MQGKGARKPPEVQDDALIQELKVRENSLQAVFMSVREPIYLKCSLGLTTPSPLIKGWRNLR
jgi:hypothetical protein